MFKKWFYWPLVFTIMIKIKLASSQSNQLKNIKDLLDLKLEMKKFCNGKIALNFCSKDFEKIANEIIDALEKKIQRENEILRKSSLKQRKINALISDNNRLKYLRDFFTLRFF